MDNCVWSKALLYDFIEAYKYNKCLWLKENRYYYNKAVKLQAYKKLVNLIQDEFPNADVLFVKKKIKNMRCSFRKELKKMSQESSIIYKPKLWYFDLLMFTVNKNNLATPEDVPDQSFLEVEFK